MKNRTPVSIFPFLSVLLSTMGVLAFLAVTFLLLSGTDPSLQKSAEELEVRWVGAPEHVRPLLVECREREIIFHGWKGGPVLRFNKGALHAELMIVRELLAVGMRELGPNPTDSRRWFYFKTAIPAEPRLRDTFTRLIHEIEIDNLTGSGRREQVERYPILLIYPGGLESYDLAARLLEMTTRLATGLEPMLPGWEVPYRNLDS